MPLKFQDEMRGAGAYIIEVESYFPSRYACAAITRRKRARETRLPPMIICACVRQALIDFHTRHAYRHENARLAFRVRVLNAPEGSWLLPFPI